MNQLSRFFRVAPFDVSVLVSTLVSLAVLAFFGIRVVLALSAGQYPDFFDLGASLLLTIIVGYALLRAVKGYRLEGTELVIERLGPGRLHIPLADIATAEPGQDLGDFVRNSFLSTQGLFGWSGKVQVRKPTNTNSLLVNVFGTNPANAVLLNLKNDNRLILTPRDVQGFVEALRESGVGDKPIPAKKSYLPAPRKKAKR